MRVIAFYLPQYYPNKTNDKWYGKGFTEWTNAAAAKPLFKGHYEPHIPADLGFYDLRVPETRRAQAKMAQEYGVEAFCYWTYWFGDGVQELDMPIWEVYKDQEITLPFCIGWANYSWEKKFWDHNASGSELIMEQKYLGIEDYEKFFYKMLPLFKDSRYERIDGKLFFIIHYPLNNPDEVRNFIGHWRKLAERENIGGFYFAGKDFESENKDKILSLGFDAVYNMDVLNIHRHLPFVRKAIKKIERAVFKRPTVYKYRDAMKHMITDDCRNDNVIPVLAPNYDHSPRSGRNAIILTDCKPKYFKRVLEKTKKLISEKPKEHQIVIAMSWNEWGEGNHLEPDRKYGFGHLEALKEVIEEG